jgi:hypothetical protein
MSYKVKGGKVVRSGKVEQVASYNNPHKLPPPFDQLYNKRFHDFQQAAFTCQGKVSATKEAVCLHERVTVLLQWQKDGCRNLHKSG